MCECRVIYGIKSIIRKEGPRDFADIMLSLQHPPNIFIVDNAAKLAKHVNKRKEDFFNPNEGRICEVSDINIECAKKGQLNVNWPWLEERKRGNVKIVDDYLVHPVTESSERFCLSDEFHKRNLTKHEDRYLRSVHGIKQLSGKIDSVGHEQFFAKMNRNKYFMNNMNSTNHLLIMRLLFHDYNVSRNKERVQFWEKQLNTHISTSEGGVPCNRIVRKTETCEQKNKHKKNEYTIEPCLRDQDEAENIADEEDISDKPTQQLDVENMDISHTHTQQLTVCATSDEKHAKPVDEAFLKSISETIAKLQTEGKSRSITPSYIDTVVCKLKHISKTSCALSDEEISAVTRNMHYMNNTIMSRKKFVNIQGQIVYSSPNPIQYQGPHPLCGLAAVNNALGTFGPIAATSMEAQNTADELWMKQAIQIGVLTVILPMRDECGNINIEVIFELCTRRGFDLRFINREITNALPSLTFKECLLQMFEELDVRKAIIVRPHDINHYLVYLLKDQHIIILDSLKTTAQTISWASFEHKIMKELLHSGCVIGVFKSEESKNNQIPKTISDESYNEPHHSVPKETDEHSHLPSEQNELLLSAVKQDNTMLGDDNYDESLTEDMPNVKSGIPHDDTATEISYADQQKKTNDFDSEKKSEEALIISDDPDQKQMHTDRYKYIAVALSDTEDEHISLNSLTPSPNDKSIRVDDYIHNINEFWKYSFSSDQQYRRIIECPENPEQPYLTVHDVQTLEPGKFVNNAIIDFVLHEIGKGLQGTLLLPTITRFVLQKQFKPEEDLSEYEKIFIPLHDVVAKHWWCVIVNNRNKTYHEFDSLQSTKFDKSFKKEFSHWAANRGIAGLETYTNLSKKERQGTPRQGSRPDCALYTLAWAVSAVLSISVSPRTISDMARTLRKTIGEYILDISAKGKHHYL